MPWERRRAGQTPLPARAPRAALRPARAALLAVLLLGPLVPAAAEGGVVARWDYVLSVPDPAAGLVRVDLTISGVEGVVTSFTFLTGGRRGAVTDVTGGPDTPLTPVPGGFEVTVDGDESFSYLVDVGAGAARPDGKLAHAGPDFVLFKAEAVALGFTYQYYEGAPLRNRSTVRLDPPEGWRAAAPWTPLGGDAYALPEGAVVPRGFVAMGDFRADEAWDAGGTRVRHVRLGQPAPFEPDLRAYLARAGPYLEAVYGHRPPDLLVVSAPDPMLRGGLAGWGSLYAHEAADLRTLAHEHAHVHQRFGPQEAMGRASVWLAEGDADWHGALSLHAAGFWSAARVNEALRDAERARDDPAFADARLADATYDTTSAGRSMERYAYHKGATVLRALDATLREATDGAAGVPELLRRLNARHADPTRDDLVVENADVAGEASRLAGRDLSGFFAQHVNGTAWPDAPPFEPAGALAVRDLAVDPPRAQPGAPVRVRFHASNEGTLGWAGDATVRLDGAPVATLPLALAVGEARVVTLDLTAPPPGDHEVQVLTGRATLRSLTPPRLVLGNVSTIPGTPRAGEPFELLVLVENHGETPASARVDAHGASLGVEVPAEGSGVAVLHLRLNVTGNATLMLNMTWSGGNETRPLTLSIAAPEERRPVQGSGVQHLAAALLAAAVALRRSGR